MALQPLQIQTPRTSLIGGQQLPKASGEGVRSPDISNSFSAFTNALLAKQAKGDADAEANKRIDDKLQGVVDVNAWRDAEVAKNPDGTFSRAPVVQGSPEYRASVHNALQDQALSDIAAQYEKRAGEIQVMFDKTAAQKTALLEGAKAGILDTVDPLYKGAARIVLDRDSSQRVNQMVAAEAEQQQKILVDGMLASKETAIKKAISIAAAGGDYTDFTQRAYKIEDQLVGLNLQDQIKADNNKAAIAGYVISSATQEQIATGARKGKIALSELNEFVEVLDVGGEATISIDAGPAPKSLHPELSDPPAPKRKIISTGELRKLFPDEAAVKAVSSNLRQLVNAMQSAANANLPMLEVEKYLKTAGPNTRIPHKDEPAYQKLVSQWINDLKALDDPDGRATVAGMVRLTKVMTPDLVDNMRLRLNSTPDKAREVIAMWVSIVDSRDGDVRIGDMIKKEMNKPDVALFDNARDVMARVMATTQDPAKQEQMYRSTMDKLADPANTVEAHVREYQENTKTDFSGAVQGLFIDFYSSRDRPMYSVPPEFQEEVAKTYQINKSLNPGADDTKMLEESFNSVAQGYQSSKIYRDGWTRGDDLSWNPHNYAAPVTPLHPGERRQFTAKPYQWTSDMVSKVVMNHLVKDKIDFRSDGPNGELRNALNTILAAGNTMPLGNGLMLVPVPGNKYEVWVDIDGASQQKIKVFRKDGASVPLLVDPHTVRSNIEGRQKSFENMQKATADAKAATIREIIRIEEGKGNLDAGNMALRVIDNPVQREKWLTDQSPEIRQLFLDNEQDRRDFIASEGKQYYEAPPQAIQEMELDDKTLMLPKATGKGVVLGSINRVGDLFGDDIDMRQLIAAIASQETKFGAVDGTFREIGDRGLTQMNTESGWVEVQRLAAIPGSEVYEMNEKAKAAFGIDVTQLTSRDLDKPLVAVLATRMYLSRASEEVPDANDHEEQARYWTAWYNPGATLEMAEQFAANAGALIVTPAQAATRGLVLDAGGPGAVTDMQGNVYPANFTATLPMTQTSALRLSAAFGKPLRVTPHGGTQPDARKSTSQHHAKTALDFYVDDYTDAEKTRLIATAVAMGYTGIGGYGAGDGKGTIHLDLRGNFAGWWRHKPGVDSKWSTGPKWFTDGIRQGMARIGRTSA